jgi:serine/threonine protein kinase
VAALNDVRRAVGRYEILRELGRGGMAMVYLARQIDLDRLVALKELSALRGSDPSFAQRFLREARLAGSLGHPNIVVVHDYFQFEGVPFIAMEYIERGSLRPFVGRMSMAQVGGVLEGLLAGLGHAEQHRIIHRDMKPENVMVTSGGRVKIADFGIAKATNTLQPGAGLTSTGTAIGTPNYMAPEQAMAQELGPWTDLYALGVMTFEFFVGRTPFADTEEPVAVALRQVNDPIPPLSELDPGVDPRISSWVQWLVEKDPKDRPQTAAEAWDALEETLISILGARWRRGNLLLDPGTTAASVDAIPEPAGDAAEPVTASMRTTVPLDDAAHAPTVAPSTPPPLSTTAQRPLVSPSKRWKRALATGLALVAVIAGIALAAGGGGGTGGGHGSSSQPSSTTGAQPSAGSGAASDSSVATQTQPSGQSSGNLAQQAESARQLYREYSDSAKQVEKLHGSSLSSSDQQLMLALQQTASAYRDAYTAAARGDAVGYTAAIAAANDAKSQLSKTVNGGGTNPVPSQQQSQSESCAGDSQSDDPSDDSCGGEP